MRDQVRRVVAGLSALILTVVVVVVVREAPARATASDSPYTVPVFSETAPAPNTDVNPDPNIVEVNLTAAPVTVNVGGGVMANMFAYNGTVPGPEFRLKPGQRVVVHFKNDLNEHTGIHWHGIELANRNDGTPLTQNQVAPGGTYLYDFVAPREGVYWYHPHHEFSTNQVFKGLYGSIIIEDPTEAALVANGTLPSAAQTKTLVLSDVTVCKDPDPDNDGSTNDTQNPNQTHDTTLPWAGGGPLPAQPGPWPRTLCDTPMDNHGDPLGTFLSPGDVPNIQSHSGRVNEGQTVLTNGMNVGGRDGDPGSPAPTLKPGAAALDVQPGQGLRLQTVNSATTRFFRLRLTDSTGALIPLVRVGGEGGLLDDAVLEGTQPGGYDFDYDQGEILLDPGDRADVVAAIPSGASGVATLWTLDFPRLGLDSHPWPDLPTVPVAHFNVTGPALNPPYSIDGDPNDGDPSTALRSATSDPVEVLAAATGSLLDPAAFAPPKPGTASQDIQFTANGGSPTINGVKAVHDFTIDYAAQPHSASTRYAKLGDVLQLTVTNTTQAHHPFHLHGFSIQPLSLTNCTDNAGNSLPVPSFTFPEAEFVDTIDVPNKCTLTLRVRIDDRPQADGTPGGGLGRWVIHCHIFFHHHQGMESELVVVGPTGDERPYVDADHASADSVAEGQAAAMTGTYSDPDGHTVSLSASLGTVQDLGGGQWSWSYTTTDGPDENQTVVITATANGVSSMTGFGLLVTNLPPTVTATSNQPVYPVGSTVVVSGTIGDLGTGDTHQCRFDWDDGGGFGPYKPFGSCTDSRVIAAAGVYSVSVQARDDDDGESVPDTVLIPVYDPSAGFVTGGGRIETLPGSYKPDPAAAGPASFGFVSRYKKGATVPDGETEFQFKAGNFNFHSTVYEWLVVSGKKAQYKGTGKVNGAGSYGFLLTATDGQLLGPTGVDKFRIKVWDKITSLVVYDNASGAPDDPDDPLANPHPITSGNIIVHKGK